MKQLTCEMCGSTDLVKQDGVFVCQSCGTKYSIEEAKKMMVEGTVDIKGTVKVDDSDKISNYLLMAKNAYEAENKKEAEEYCNKIIEVEPNNYEAWFIKGKAAGWQSTLAKIRIEETVNCFVKAIENAPKDKCEEIKADAAKETESLSMALVTLCCNNYSKFASVDNARSIKEKTLMVQLYALQLLTKAGVTTNSFKEELATKINNAVVAGWDNYIWKNYWEDTDGHPSKFIWNQFTEQAWAAVDLAKFAVTLRGKDSKKNKTTYSNIIFYIKAIESSAEYTYSNSNWHKGATWNQEYKNKLIDQIMEYHNKIKEIDPDYASPERPQPSSGCYVATAVYGSYDCPQVWTLRRFRDYTLAKTWYGRTFIRIYYTVSPTLVKWFGQTEWFKRMWRGQLDRMVTKLQSRGVESTPYQDREW